MNFFITLGPVVVYPYQKNGLLMCTPKNRLNKIVERNFITIGVGK